MERKQPVVVGTDHRGELVWGFVPMAYWQMAMFPIRYLGDFQAHWQRMRLLFEYGVEGEDAVSTDFKSYVPWQLADKYADKRRGHKGD